MRFYHCFHTDLPDQFVEANVDMLKNWVGDWPDVKFLRRATIIDGVELWIDGNQKTDAFPTVRHKPRMIDMWMNKKGDQYNGRYWESLAEDQRSPDRKSRNARRTSAVPLTTLQSWYPPAPAFGSGPGLTTADLQKMYDLIKQQALISRPLLWGSLQEFEKKPKPPLKREGVVAGEIVGYRCWRIENGLLRSVYQRDVWQPGQVLEGRELGDWDSRGIHAWKDKGSKHYHDYIRGYLNRENDAFAVWRGIERQREMRPAMVTGTVFLWGDVVEHERGWRAEFARVRSLDWLYPDETMMGNEEEALHALRAKYGVLS